MAIIAATRTTSSPSRGPPLPNSALSKVALISRGLATPSPAVSRIATVTTATCRR
jgi:hypothetical protein